MIEPRRLSQRWLGFRSGDARCLTAARTAYRRGLRPYLARCLTAIAKRTGEDYPEPYLERQLSACHERPRADDAGSVGAFQDANYALLFGVWSIKARGRLARCVP